MFSVIFCNKCYLNVYKKEIQWSDIEYGIYDTSRKGFFIPALSKKVQVYVTPVLRLHRSQISRSQIIFCNMIGNVV